MGTEPSQHTMQQVTRHIEQGIPLEELRLGDKQRERVKLCLELYHRFEDNPYMDVDMWLKRKGRRTWQIVIDKQIFLHILSLCQRNSSREMSKVIVRRVAMDSIRHGDAVGDNTAKIKGAELLKDIDHLDKEDSAVEAASNTAQLPIFLTSRVETISSDKKTITRKELIALYNRYGGTKDHIQQMLEQRMEELERRSLDDDGSGRTAAYGETDDVDDDGSGRTAAYGETDDVDDDGNGETPAYKEVEELDEEDF